MTGKKGLSGRRKGEGTLIKEGLDIMEENYPDLVRALIHKAILQLPVVCPQCECEFTVPGGGNEASIHYAIDRILGKPKQAIEQKNLSLTAEIQLTPTEVRKYLETIRQKEIELLNGVPPITDEVREDTPI